MKVLLRIESYEIGRLNTQINHMFQPNREAHPSPAPLHLGYPISDIQYRMTHIT